MFDGVVWGHIMHLDGVTEVLAGVLGSGAQLLLNAEDLVVLGEALWAARGSSLDLAGGESHHQVGDEGVLSLTGPVGDHGAPAIALGQEMGLDGLCDGADLVDLQQQAVARLLLNAGLDALGVGHLQTKKQIIN